MLIEDKKTWNKIVKEGKGYIYNDFDTQFPGISTAWNSRDFNKLHTCSCLNLKRMNPKIENKKTKYFFETKKQALDWLEATRKDGGYTLCKTCKP